MDINLTCFHVSLLAILFLIVDVSAQNVNGDIRLRGINSTATQGRVEVYYQGVWGTVCDDGFDTAEAIVVCRQLGVAVPSNAIAVTDGRFGPGTGDILIDDINCQATEPRLSDCTFGNWNDSNCKHDEDVGVICPTSTATPQSTRTPPTTVAPVIPDTGNCTAPDEDIRLVGPSNLNGVGVVQIRRNGIWGGVCDNGWNMQAARVVCRMLCFDPNKALSGGVAFDTSGIPEPMTVDNVTCTGNEATLDDCSQSIWLNGSCRRSEMAKVTCVDLDNTPPRRPEPLLECSDGLLSASFSRSRDPFLEEKHLSVALTYTGPCNAVLSTDADYVTMQVPFDECGTRRSSNATHIIYRSVIKYLPTFTTGDISHANTYMIQVQCELPREVLADKPIVPLTETVTQIAPGEFVVNMHFYRKTMKRATGRNNSFRVPVTQFPLEIPLGEWLNTALELKDVDKNLRLVVPNCYATPTADKNDPVRYPLFTNKCSNDPTVGFFPLNETWFGYRYQTFKFVQYSEVYIHCDAYICERDDPNPLCDRSCFPTTTTSTTTASTGNARKRRSIVEPRHVYVTSGTLVVYDPNPSNEIVRPVVNTTTKRSDMQSSSKVTTDSPPVTTRHTSTIPILTSQSETVSNHVTSTLSKETSQSQTVSNHVTPTAHVTDRKPGIVIVEEIYDTESSSISTFRPCSVIIFISFLLHFIRL